MSDSTEEYRATLVMERSSYSQVVFMDVPRSYPPSTPVKCSFTVTGELIPTSKDWIGVFKVGWNSTQKYYNYVWVEPPLENDGTEPLKLEVAFSEYYLPKDDGEFYQFCYVDSGGQVRGASTPFCFQIPAESSLDSSLEKDILVITTQEQAEQMEKEKKGLVTEMEHLKEEKKILKNELDERLREIHRLRMYIDKLKADSTAETQPSKEQRSEIVEQVTRKEQLLCDAVAEDETKQEQEVPTTPSMQPASMIGLQDKYDKAMQKISMLKQEKLHLEEQVEAQQAKNLQLDSKMKEAEEDFHRLQDHVQLLQVDVQSSRKENERLHSEIQETIREVEGLRVENKALKGALSEQGPSDGENVKVQTILKQLTEARGTLHNEISNCNEANRRADKAEMELKELRKQLEQRPVAEEKQQNKGQIEAQLKEALRRIDEQDNAVARNQLEKEELYEENKKLKEDVSRLQKQLYELQVASVAAVAKPQTSPISPSFTDPFSGPELPPHYFDNIAELSGNSAGTENKKVCRHCQVCFPEISEDELTMHEQSHKVCPFCTLICDDLEQQEFEDHVYSHE
ncbi:calcium-binding and coiled-coil domain-containing protein 2 [Astyanax mexicanus]|uniref:calcium-binding and coiled-coil domain-containing protein 2 n=1 Tax=Astyanax mexicanus TaxID=7994 RepID=UPI0020CB2689|nr:calcium-binding and coiled-coil domain-containing protein 2 [Astyanax mexicanus]